jgi:hypothetical protein
MGKPAHFSENACGNCGSIFGHLISCSEYKGPNKTLAEKRWEYTQMLADEKEKNGWGNKYQLRVQAWKGEWASWDTEPLILEVINVHSYALKDWDEDIKGGPGLYISTVFKSPKGKSYTVSTIIPKDELIKALALLVRD